MILARHKIACVVNAQLFYGRAFLYIKRGLDYVTCTVLHIIGMIAYAISGAFVAIQAKYSFIGIFVLGLTTSVRSARHANNSDNLFRTRLLV
ncbi:TRIC cation channel family protein [Lysinibacillus sp. NPDC097279]|uniref:TRIC cation channel family protein n=1 Tax=Lysinibacillus sp. NPDC097279 TaxID=3364143 RepID=UPI00382A2788